MSETDDVREVCDHLVAFERLLAAELHVEANARIAALDVEATGSAALLAILGITTHTRDELPSRTLFVQRVDELLTRRLGAERARRLMELRR